MVRSFALLASLVALVYANPHGERAMRVHEFIDGPPAGFVHSGSASANLTLSLRFALVQNNFKGLEDALYAVSTPGSPQYGQHLSKQEVEALVAPTPETVAAVNEWLSSNGIESSKASPSGDWISAPMTVEQANKILDANFATFTQLDTGVKAVRTLSYSIPDSLKAHISLIHPTVAFPLRTSRPPLTKTNVKIIPNPPSNATSDSVPASCASQVTPVCLQAQYGIPAAPATQSSNQLGVSAFLNQFASVSDLQDFLEEFRPDLPSTNSFEVLSVDGGENDESDPGIEASLDIEYTVAVASNVPITFITVGDGTATGFLDEINALLALDNPPQVLTTSYGFDENQLPKSIAENLCNSYSQLGARGVSLLFSSGDGGVSGSQSQSCSSFIPTFPSSCPYVTSVGGTQGVNPEVAASLSGGGFSNYFGRPSYQANAVSAYLNTLGSTNAGRFKASGSRAFPDVAAPAENVLIVSSGEVSPVAGTSCASPIFASVIALLNDQLIAAGKSPLGFLNPLIYDNPSAFNDIASGANPGCGTDGFPAAAGWDPVTGMGSPNFAALARVVGL
ncbi:serine protease S53 [Heterobasidion irregulare TC 32-1]|uniref:tripeptidyl-peptidase II n=1 Tax=Heterobasidion irregulare (strain TC 32-1) TaxID=747525 RepID=W4JXF3_HETIT|nr:serine protease S53 [Heterobasidion irregulare TC 32-1]ETW78242.1 serine protease S53 [Heterobasidion irregulare TC 32-1]